MQKKKKIFTFELQGREVVFEIDSFPLRAEKSVLCRYGDTTVFTTLCTKDLEKKPDFLRLTIFVNEKFYSIGKIPPLFGKREGRPGYESVIIARMIDRSLRSCLSLDDRKEIQITNTILSLGENHEPRLAAFWNSFIVCFLSEELAFDKLISIIVLAKNNDLVIHNPCSKQLEKSPFEIVVVGSKEKIIALEMWSREISEKEVEELVEIAHLEIIKTIEKFSMSFLTEDLLEKKRHLRLVSEQRSNDGDPATDMQVIDQTRTFFHQTITNKDLSWDKKKYLLEEFPFVLSRGFPAFEVSALEEFYDKFLQSALEKWMSDNKVRIDNRSFDQLREVSMEIDYIPAVHGSSLFSRGNTSVISVLTFKRGNEKQAFDDTLTHGIGKSFIHHYNFPSFAVNRLSSAVSISRREIGHGQLVEKTFFKLLPSPSEFPYTTRIVSEVVSSEGSSSQASVCASSLAMMASGFPLAKHVAGVSLGLIAGNIITDISDFEDKFGEIDFKIAGTEDGICSLQLDLKNEGIDLSLLSKCLEQGRKARITIIELMKKVINEPRKQLSPKILKFQRIYLGVDKLGLVIGSKGKNIDLVTSTTGASVDIKEDGFAFVYHAEQEKLLEAVEMLRKLATR